MSNKSELVNSPFDPSLIRMESRVYSIYNLLSRLQHEEIITPDYQRQKIWNVEAKSRLIESLLVRIPIPSFYMDATNEDQWKVIDGLQRLTALKEFIIDGSLKLQNLEYLLDFNGLCWADLPRPYQRRIYETEVTVVIINSGTPENVKYNIFKRINTGGEPLSAQEIRHALYNGKASKLIKKIANRRAFKDVWTFIKDDRMELSELALRGFGYFILDQKNIFELNYDDYLSAAMRSINELDDETLSSKIMLFNESFDLIVKIFGEYSFRKITTNSQRRNTPNKNIYETLIAVFSQFDILEQDVFLSNKKKIYQQITDLLSDRGFGYLISSRKPDGMRKRSEQVNKVLMEIIQNDQQYINKKL